MKNLMEAKRYVRRYYIRPQDIFASNKRDIIKALIEISDNNENCSVYTLNNLGDEKDVTKLTNDDIIYYYDDGILYDKNHVKIFDYDLAIKHEENRKKFTGKLDMDKPEVKNEYEDRITEIDTEMDEELKLKEDKNSDFITKKGQKDPYLRLLWELMHTNMMTGEKETLPDYKCYAETRLTDDGNIKGQICVMTKAEEAYAGFDGLKVEVRKPQYLNGAKKVAEELGLPYVVKLADSHYDKNKIFIDYDAVDEITVAPNLYQYVDYEKRRATKKAAKLAAEKAQIQAPEAAAPEEVTSEEAFDLKFEDVNAFGEKLCEGKEVNGICCICGEEFEGYGNNPEPYMTAENGERCCDSCNIKFVIPARLDQLYLSRRQDK